MKLRTSSFKSVALKKDIFRYAPIWALYLIGMLLVLMEQGGRYDYDRLAKHVMPDLITSFAVVNLIYAGVVAVMLFGDLYNTKMCYCLHAMPYRRESWLATHLVAGMLFSLVPNCVAAIYLAVTLQNYWFIALYWLLAVTLQYLFFFGVATFSALLTGQRFAMLLVYAGFNFVAMLLYGTVQVIYIPMLEGVVVNMEDFSQFCPTVELFNFEYFAFSSKLTGVGITERIVYVYEGLEDGWGYHAVIAAVGLVAMGGALWLYRIRQMESAGDFVAFAKMKTVACAVMTLCVTLCFALLGEAFGSGYLVWMAVGLVVGFFGSLMLLERRLRVFRKKTFLGFGIMVVAVTLSLCAMGFDWFGIESWTPNASQVQSVTVSNYKTGSYDYDYGDGRLKTTWEDPQDIEEIILAHEDILNRLDEKTDTRYRVTLSYKLKSGRTVTRSYTAPGSGLSYRVMQMYLYTQESVLGYKDAQVAAQGVQYVYCLGCDVPPELYQQVFEALQADYIAGGVVMGYDEAYYIEYGFYDGASSYVYRTLGLNGNGGSTIALMKSPEMILGYSDWEAFLAGIKYLQVGEAFLTQEQYAGLLEAMRQDIALGVELLTGGGEDAVRVQYDYMDTKGNWISRYFYIGKEAVNTLGWIEENIAQA